MDKRTAYKFYEAALAYVTANHSDELKWVKGISPATFARLDFPGFLGQYCWVVYASGFRVSVVEKHFERLTTAFCDFDPERLCRMRSLAAVLAINANARKAKGFVQGAKRIREEGFEKFKARVNGNGMAVLRKLPFIGPVTQKHLARNIGLQDVSKDDVHLVRLAQKVGAPCVQDLTEFLAGKTGEGQGVVDLVLWRYCADGGQKVLKALT